MIISQVIQNLSMTVREIVNGLANRLTAQDNFGPEGERFQVLTSNGDRIPPSYQDLVDILTGISIQDPEALPGIPGLVGPPGPPGSGVSTPYLRGAHWSNQEDPIDLGGQILCFAPRSYVNGTITGCRIVGEPVGDAHFGIKKCPVASAFPAGLVDITAGGDAIITADTNVLVDTAGWDLAVVVGDIFEFELKAVSGFTQVQVFIEITPL